MNEMIEGLEGVKVIVDDLLIFGQGENMSEAVNDHDKNLVALLDRLTEKNIKLNESKIRFKTN